MRRPEQSSVNLNDDLTRSTPRQRAAASKILISLALDLLTAKLRRRLLCRNDKKPLRKSIQSPSRLARCVLPLAGTGSVLRGAKKRFDENILSSIGELAPSQQGLHAIVDVQPDASSLIVALPIIVVGTGYGVNFVW